MRFILVILAFLLPVSAAAMPFDEARHLLARTGFGPTIAALAAFRELTYEDAVTRLLAEVGSEASLPAPDWIAGWRPPPRRKDMSQSAREALRDRNREQAQDLKAWWLREMIATPAPLTEVMTLFWHNHFTSGLQSVRAPALLFRQNVLLRRHALGNFGALLRAITRDPAMLIYLDGARNRKTAPNENFARELFELFTLGEGHYSEADVKAAARAFTGWSLDRRTGKFLFRANWHDSGAKTLLGRHGNFDGDDVVDLLLAHPRTAELITEKLWQYFVSETPDPPEVTRLADLFRAQDYEIKALLKGLLTSPAFRAVENRGRLIKSPVDLVVGALRLFDLPLRKAADLTRITRRLGQDLFNPPNVKGWPGGTAWITADRLLIRQALLARLTGEAGSMMKAGMKTDDGSAQRRRAAVFDRWFQDLGAPWQSADALAGLLLPLAPADNPVLDRDGSSALVRSLLTDPVYQLK